IQRLNEYFQKAFREAKVHSNWAQPNEEYENACIAFTKKILENGSSFKKTFIPFFDKISWYGTFNSIGQLILKFTCPGIPDIYQGTELWDLSLVDPDNRRPVNYEARMKMLDDERSLDELMTIHETGEIKIAVM